MRVKLLLFALIYTSSLDDWEFSIVMSNWYLTTCSTKYITISLSKTRPYVVDWLTTFIFPHRNVIRKLENRWPWVHKVTFEVIFDILRLNLMSAVKIWHVTAKFDTEDACTQHVIIKLSSKYQNTYTVENCRNWRIIPITNFKS